MPVVAFPRQTPVLVDVCLRQTAPASLARNSLHRFDAQAPAFVVASATPSTIQDVLACGFPHMPFLALEAVTCALPKIHLVQAGTAPSLCGGLDARQSFRVCLPFAHLPMGTKPAPGAAQDFVARRRPAMPLRADQFVMRAGAAVFTSQTLSTPLGRLGLQVFQPFAARPCLGVDRFTRTCMAPAALQQLTPECQPLMAVLAPHAVPHFRPQIVVLQAHATTLGGHGQKALAQCLSLAMRARRRRLDVHQGGGLARKGVARRTTEGVGDVVASPFRFQACETKLGC